MNRLPDKSPLLGAVNEDYVDSQSRYAKAKIQNSNYIVILFYGGKELVETLVCCCLKFGERRRMGEQRGACIVQIFWSKLSRISADVCY